MWENLFLEFYSLVHSNKKPFVPSLIQVHITSAPLMLPTDHGLDEDHRGDHQEGSLKISEHDVLPLSAFCEHKMI